MFSSVVNVQLLPLIETFDKPGYQRNRKNSQALSNLKYLKIIIHFLGFLTSSVGLICFFCVSTHCMRTQSGMIHMSCKMMHDSFSKEGQTESYKQWYFSFPLLCEQSFPVYFLTVEDTLLHQTLRSKFYYRVARPVNVLTCKQSSCI